MKIGDIEYGCISTNGANLILQLQPGYELFISNYPPDNFFFTLSEKPEKFDKFLISPSREVYKEGLKIH